MEWILDMMWWYYWSADMIECSVNWNVIDINCQFSRLPLKGRILTVSWSSRTLWRKPWSLGPRPPRAPSACSAASPSCRTPPWGPAPWTAPGTRPQYCLQDNTVMKLYVGRDDGWGQETSSMLKTTFSRASSNVNVQLWPMHWQWQKHRRTVVDNETKKTMNSDMNQFLFRIPLRNKKAWYQIPGLWILPPSSFSSVLLSQLSSFCRSSAWNTHHTGI